MKKAILAILIIIIGVMMVQGVAISYPVYARENTQAYNGINRIDFNSAKESMLSNNRALKDMKESLKDYQERYEKALDSADEIEDEDFYDMPNHYYRMFLYKTKELVPELQKYGLITAEDNAKNYEEQLKVNLRTYYGALAEGCRGIEVQKKRYALDRRKHDANVIRYKNGLITELELEESEYNLLRAQMELTQVTRNYENTCRSFNLYIGRPIETSYNWVEYDELHLPLYEIDFFYDEALKNRNEIKSIERQIDLKKLEMEILERNQVNTTYTEVRKDYDNLARGIKTLRLDMEKAGLDIKKEIYSMYTEVINGDNAIRRAKRNIEDLKRKYNLADARHRAGILSDLDVEQIKIEILSAETLMERTIFDYNSKLIRLYTASGLHYVIGGENLWEE